MFVSAEYGKRKRNKIFGWERKGTVYPGSPQNVIKICFYRTRKNNLIKKTDTCSGRKAH